MLISDNDSIELENAEYIRIYHGDELMALYSYDKKAHCYRCFKYLG
jgi:hypothetical protein